MSASSAPPALESLDHFVQWATETAQTKGPKVVDWLYAEVPEVVNQFLAWNFAESLVTFLICAFFIFAWPFVNYKIARGFYVKFKVNDWRDEGSYWCVTLIGSFLVNLAGQMSSWSHINLVWLKIALAPKVYLLETFAKVLH
jgi:hypothetical protein